jgi:hypothetical protein
LKFIICSILAIASTFSFSSGITTWIIFFCAI